LRGESRDKLKPVGEPFLLAGRLGENVGRDERHVDLGVVEKQSEVAEAAVAKHGKDAHIRALREEASHVGGKLGLGGGGRTRDQAKPRLGATVLRRLCASGLAREEAKQNGAEKNPNATQYTPRFPALRAGHKKGSRGAGGCSRLSQKGKGAASERRPPSIPNLEADSFWQAFVCAVRVGPGPRGRSLLIVEPEVNHGVGRHVGPNAAKGGRRGSAA
jgi:hypothetical protein